MTIFWILMAAMILVALAFIAPALLRHRDLEASDRDQQNVVIARERLADLKSEYTAGALSEEEYEQSRAELEQALLIDLDVTEDAVDSTRVQSRGGWTLLVAGLFLVVTTVMGYLYLGDPQMVSEEAMLAHQSGQKMQSVDQMIGALVERLKANPEDAEGWYLLGRTYMVMKDYKKAAFAFDKVNQLASNQPSIMLALADSLAMVAGGDLQGRPAELIRKAITLAPEDQTALWLAGMVEEQSGNYAQALVHWRHLKGKISDDQQSLQRVDKLIAEAEAKMSTAGPGATPTKKQDSVAAAKAITARITLSDKLASKVKPGESLFVYARALTGPKMPLAAVRMKVSDLPATVELNDGLAMVPGMNISRFSQVVVGARISHSGNAIAASGDLLGEVSPVKVTAGSAVDIVIDSVIP